MQLTLNLSQSKSKLASIMLLDSVNGHKIPKDKDIQQFMTETVDFLKKSEGISNIKKSVDLTNYIASVSFSFKDVTKINGIVKRLLEKEKVNAPDNTYSFDNTTKTFKRSYRYSTGMKEGYNKLSAKDKDIFKSASYVNIFRFQNNITSSANKAAKISPSGKAIMLNVPAMEVIFGTANISNSIQLNK